MPWDRRRYPPNWEYFSYFIKSVRARGRCECTGECGLHQPAPHFRRCVEQDKHRALYFKGTVHLTTAHLCQCNPPCTNEKHVKAMCQRCHLRTDAPRKAKQRKERNQHPKRDPAKQPPEVSQPY